MSSKHAAPADDIGRGSGENRQKVKRAPRPQMILDGGLGRGQAEGRARVPRSHMILDRSLGREQAEGRAQVPHWTGVSG